MKKYIMTLAFTGIATMLCTAGICAMESQSRPTTIFKHVRQLESAQTQPIIISAKNFEFSRPVEHELAANASDSASQTSARAPSSVTKTPKSATILATTKTEKTTASKSVIKSSASGHQYVMAKILNVKPKYITKTIPQRYCQIVRRDYLVNHRDPFPAAGVFVGGITGGLIGNQFGQGGGNILSTVGGTVIGALVGDQIQHQIHHPHIHSAYYKVCKTKYRKKQVIKGYNVTYTYNGQKDVKFMKNRPHSNFVQIAI